MDYNLDYIDPFSIPLRTLYSGAFMPAIAFDTTMEDCTPEEMADAVRAALGVGYRHFSCSIKSGNQEEVGKALREALYEIPREELFISSKLWNDSHEYDAAVESCVNSLHELRLNYFDLFTIEWPFTNYMQDGETQPSEDARAYNHDSYMSTWRALEEMHASSVIKHLGTGNISVAKLELLLRDVDIMPAIAEIEMHPTFQQKELFDFCALHEINTIASRPLGAMSQAESLISDIENPVVMQIAADRGITPQEVLIRWAIARGQTPIVSTTDVEKMHLYLSATMESLNGEELERLERVECNNRVIKGERIIWKKNQNWRDVWDEGGVVIRG